MILDRGSMNGTFVEGVRVRGARCLRDADVISFADVGFIFREKHP